MSLTAADLDAIKALIDESLETKLEEKLDAKLDAKIPQLIAPMLEKMEKRIIRKIDQLTLDVGQFSLETTENFSVVNERLNRFTKLVGNGTDRLAAGQ
jgi:hypothetical protein